MSTSTPRKGGWLARLLPTRRRRRAGRSASSLRARLLVGAVTPLVMAAALQAGYNVIAQRKAMMSGLEDKARTVTSLLVNVVGPNLALGDQGAVKEGLSSLADGEEFVFALVTGADGATVAYRGRRSERDAHERRVAHLLGVVSDGPLTLAVAPVEMDGKAIGRVSVGLSTAAVKEKVARIVLRAALISAGGGAGAIFVVWLLAQEVVRRNRDMRLLLASMDQGFLTLGRDGRLAAERSRIVDRWLGRVQEGLTFWQCLDPIDADVAGWFELGWMSLIEDAMPLEVAIDSLPKRIRRGAQTLQIVYKPLMKAHAFDKMLVVLTDITAQLERERIEATQHELLAVSQKISADRRGFLEFADDADALSDAIGRSTADDETRRLIHTLKGNAALFGVKSVTTICHEVETRIEDQGSVDPSDLVRCTEAWRQAKERFSFLIGARTNSTIELSEQDWRELVEAAARRLPHAEIERRLRAVKMESTRQRLLRFGDQAQALAGRLGKGNIAVQVEDNGVRLQSERWTPFWSTFGHLVRNAVDHGLESPEAREAAGKPANGTIWLRTYEQDERLFIEIADDGGGIDWERLAQKAREQNLPTETRADLIDALFADGVSTRDQATELSGRGVGLAAVRSTCRELGGELAIESTPGCGTKFTFYWRMPRALESERAAS